MSGGRDIAPAVNWLLNHPAFSLRIATKDYHPPDHISFAANHPAPDNIAFESVISMTNYKTPAGHDPETKPQRLWPVHCVSGTNGAEFIPEFNADQVDVVVKKGMDPKVEMYSAFTDAFGNPDSSGRAVDVQVRDVLREHGITDVFVAGLAMDYCVRCTAVDAVNAGFTCFVVDDATRCVLPEHWEATREDLRRAGVAIVRTDGPELRSI